MPPRAGSEHTGIEPRRTFMDGCHRYGITPGLFVQLVGMLVMFAYFTGQLKVAQEQVADRMTRIERVLDSVLLKMIK